MTWEGFLNARRKSRNATRRAAVSAGVVIARDSPAVRPAAPTDDERPRPRDLFLRGVRRSTRAPAVARRHQGWWWVHPEATTRRLRATHPRAQRAAVGPQTTCVCLL